MSQFLVLSHMRIQNANAVAGLTWGFPSVTHFLGFTHALSRTISKGDETTFSGCAVISNSTQQRVYQPKAYADFEFLQSKNPPVLAKHKKASPPIIEEGKMNLTVSLIIELTESLSLTTGEITSFERKVRDAISTMRVAGGVVLEVGNIRLFSASTEKQQTTMLRNIKRLTMPGFVLLDRSDYLEQHYETLKTESEGSEELEQPELIDAWLDFSALKYEAIPRLAGTESEANENTLADWRYVPKPRSGYLVPLMTGYKAISDLYPVEAVEATRDSLTPARYVEAIHSVGEWKGFHRIKSIDEIIWRYRQDGAWYLCEQLKSYSVIEDMDIELAVQFVSSEDALNQF